MQLKTRPVAIAGLAMLAACNLAEGPMAVACPDIGWIPILAEIRDQNGRPAANGATVRIVRTDGYTDETRGYGEDEVRVGVGEPVTGLFDVMVSKPYHQGDSVRGVEVRGDRRCGIPTAPGVATLTVTLETDAPPVRQVVVPPFSYGFGDGNVTGWIRAFVEADNTASHRATWVSRDTTVARITAEGEITSTCRDTYGWTHLVAVAVADPTVRDSVVVHTYASDPASGRCP